MATLIIPIESEEKEKELKLVIIATSLRTGVRPSFRHEGNDLIVSTGIEAAEILAARYRDSYIRL